MTAPVSAIQPKALLGFKGFRGLGIPPAMLVLFEATVDFLFVFEMFGSIIIRFCGFRAILMFLAVWAGLFKLEWCRYHPQNVVRGQFLNNLGCDNLRGNFFACK